MDRLSLTNYFNGVRLAFPIVAGYIPLGFACGVVSQAAGMDSLQVILMSLLVFAGAGQYVAAGMIAINASPLSIAVTVFIINLRHLLYTSALFSYIPSWTKGQKAVFAAQITDETFALHSSLCKPGEELDYSRAVGINTTSHQAWIIGNLIGAISGSLITDGGKFGLDFALPALFIALIIPKLVNRFQIIAGVTAVIFAIIFTSLGLSYWGVVLASILASVIALFFMERKS